MTRAQIERVPEAWEKIPGLFSTVQGLHDPVGRTAFNCILCDQPQNNCTAHFRGAGPYCEPCFYALIKHAVS